MVQARPTLTATRRWRSTAELVAALTGRDLQLRYQGSVFGWAWSLVRPLALGLILSFALGKRSSAPGSPPNSCWPVSFPGSGSRVRSRPAPGLSSAMAAFSRRCGSLAQSFP
ncbi:MAG: hypothetical protein IPN07_16445 [Dehalococcoidia bacterium]|nr:hypothetical protein [Dehalococcoidia bacterium]